MELFKSLESRTKSFNDPFEHFEINQPLTKEAIEEIKEEMSDFLTKGSNQWKELFNEIINDWEQETGDSPFPVQSLINFMRFY